MFNHGCTRDHRASRPDVGARTRLLRRWTAMKASIIASPVFLAGTSASPRPRDEWILSPRDGLAAGPPAICPPVARVTIELTPICYRKSFSSTTIIDPFENGDYLTISNVPTTVSTTSTRTNIIEASTSVSGSGWSLSLNLSSPKRS